jgi:putative hemolysin
MIWSLFVFCLVVSFLLSGMEAGVFALSRLRIRQQMRTGRRSAEMLHGYLERPENFLWTILVGNTLANLFILGWLMGVVYNWLGSVVWFVPVYALCVFLFYTFFDLLPKMLFRTYPNRLCLAMARPFRMIHVLLRPLVALVEFVSAVLLHWRRGSVFTGRPFGNREELRLLMQDSAQALTSDERAMINRVMELQSLTVRQVMTPLSRTLSIAPETPLETIFDLAREKKFSRLPVLERREGGEGRVRGILRVSRLLYAPELDPGKPAGDFIEPALFLEEDLRLEVALRRMQRAGQRLAIVLGRDRRELGIISVQDILNTILLK